jgi:CHAD domain-containing protein
MQPIAPTTPASQAVRARLTAVLDEAVVAAARLSGSGDPEALHDVRVALRRLRVLLRAYESELHHAVPGWLAEDVAALAGRTGAARDLEVFEEWLAAKAKRLPLARRSTARWLLAKVEERKNVAYRGLRRLVPRGVAALEPLLRAGLEYRPPAGESKGASARTFRALTARRALKRLEDLLAALGKVRTVDDDDVAHRARISAKKLRYILEPAVSARSPRLIKGIKALQDDFGRFHDLDVARIRIRAARRAKADDGGPAPAARLAGLDVLLALAEREKAALFDEIRRLWLTGSPARLAPVRRWIGIHSREGKRPEKQGSAAAG